MKHLKKSTHVRLIPQKPALAQGNLFLLYDNFGNLLFQKTSLKGGTT